MSIISGKPYKIVNRVSRLALDLSKEDHKSILGENVKPVNSQTWIPEFLVGGSGPGVLIKSAEEDDLYIGFEGDAEEGKTLTGVRRDHAKVWEIQRNPTPDYVITLKAIKGPHFLMVFPRDNLHPGTHAQLGVPFLEATNQIWVFTLVK